MALSFSAAFEYKFIRHLPFFPYHRRRVQKFHVRDLTSAAPKSSMAKDYHFSVVFRRWRRPVKFPDSEWVSERLKGQEACVEAVVYEDGSVKYFHGDAQLEGSEWAYVVSAFFQRD